MNGKRANREMNGRSASHGTNGRSATNEKSGSRAAESAEHRTGSASTRVSELEP